MPSVSPALMLMNHFAWFENWKNCFNLFADKSLSNVMLKMGQIATKFVVYFTIDIGVIYEESRRD